MILLFIFLLFIIFIIYIIKNKIIFRFDTLFRKGFKKLDDKYGVFCFCGKQGDGKTISILDVFFELYKDKIIYTNVKSFYLRNKEYLHIVYEPDFVKIHDYFINIEDCSNYVIFFDEIFSLVEKGQLDSDYLLFLSQMRKRKLYFYTTCQEWLELNVTFRRYVRYMVECNMFNLPLFNCAISVNAIYNAYKMKWSNLENEYVCPIIKTTIKKCSLTVANSYDTFETIQVQGSLLKKAKAR